MMPAGPKTVCRWCRTWSELSEKYGIALSILGVNTLCEVGMNRKEKWEEVKIFCGQPRPRHPGWSCSHAPSQLCGPEKYRIGGRTGADHCVPAAMPVELGMQYQEVEIGHEAALCPFRNMKYPGKGGFSCLLHAL